MRASVDKRNSELRLKGPLKYGNMCDLFYHCVHTDWEGTTCLEFFTIMTGLDLLTLDTVDTVASYHKPDVRNPAT